MSLSTSNSKIRHTGRLRKGIGLFLAVFAIMCVFGELLSRDRMIASYANLDRRFTDIDFHGKYIGSGPGGVETLHHELYYYGTGQAIPRAKAADILILGSSRPAMGFAQAEWDAYTKHKGWTYYNMGMAFREGNTYAEVLIRKHRLRPKVVIINVDDFFNNRPSQIARLILDRTDWEHAKRAIEIHMDYFYVVKARRWVPFFFPKARAPKVVPVPTDHVIAISEKTGSWHLVPSGYRSPADYRDRQRPDDQPNAESFAAAQRMVAELRRIGAEVIFTLVPFDGANYVRAQKLSDRLDVPLIAPRMEQVDLWDGSHLTPERAREFTRTFLAEMEGYLSARRP